MNARPNVLLIECDQLAVTAVGTCGGAVPTPNLDRLAACGTSFTEAICTSPSCSPSRASIVTGLHPHRHGITYNLMKDDYLLPGRPETEEGLRAGEWMTENVLHRAGWTTLHHGKWHLLGEVPEAYAEAGMYLEHHAYAEEMAATFAEVRERDPSTWMDWYGWALPVEQTPAFEAAVRGVGDAWAGNEYAGFVTGIGRLDLPPGDLFDLRVADRCVASIEESGRSGEPFMLTCSLNLPHDPNVVPSPWYERFDPETLSLPANFDAIEDRFRSSWSHEVVERLGEAGLREFLRVYHASVSFVDDQVGRLLDALDASGLRERTVVVFTADHGDLCGAHRMVWKSNESFYEEVVRVPLIVSVPGAAEPRACGVACSLVDLAPTLLELCGQPLPDHLDGRSLARFLGPDAEDDPADPGVAFCSRLRAHPSHTRAAPDLGGSFMARTPRWKYALHTDGEPEAFLYDLKSDPGETRNLHDDPAAAGDRDRMRAALLGWLEAEGLRESAPG